jgi:predicted acyl esterase
MYGKSYDGVTGLVGAVTQPPGLAAVVAQEPVYDLYRYLYSNGVRFVNSLATPALYARSPRRRAASATTWTTTSTARPGRPRARSRTTSTRPPTRITTAPTGRSAT